MASFLLPHKKYMYYDEGGFLKMEINKKFLVSSIGAVIVVIAGGVYANVKAMNSIKKDIKAIKEKQSDTMYAVDCLTKSDTLQNQINNNIMNWMHTLNDQIDLLKKSNKK